MNTITRGVRNAFRNSVRTSSVVIILGLSIGLSLAMSVSHQAVGKRIASVKANVGNTITISPAGVRGFEGGGSPLTEDQLSKVKSLSHVTGLEESLNDRLDSTNTNLVSAIDLGQLGQRFAERFGGGGGGAFGGDMSFSPTSFTPPVTVIGTTNPTDLANTQGGGTFSLKSGKIFDGTSAANVALVGSTLASKNNLSVGSTFSAYNQTITVDGIFDAGNTFSNNLVILPLASEQQLSGQSGDVTSAVASVDSISNLDSVTNNIKSTLGSTADVTSSTDRANQIVAPLQNVQTISLYSLISAVVAGAVIILLVMIMIVRERRREIGVLKAIGASNFKVVSQFVSEAVTFTGLGAVVGILFGVAASSPLTHFLVNSSSTTNTVMFGSGGGGGGRGFGRVSLGGVGRNLQNIHTAVGWNIILYGLLAALLIAVVGSACVAFFIAKIRPAEVIRTE